ncbi:MAG: hypothetical protein IT371_04365 [Deltaproteobacteria bacterium]|nr:hypothetical protein [Deltaproteobacteria bacterium]
MHEHPRRGLRVLGTLGLLALAACKGSASAPIAFDALLSACVRINACGVMARARVTNCVDAYYTTQLPVGLGPVYAELYRCVNDAGGSCDEVRRCFGEQSTERCDATFRARCDGARAVSCDLLDKRIYAADCGAAALSCAVPSKDTFAARCGAGTCGADFTPRCDGSRRLTCVNGVVEVEDCAAQSLVCDEGAARCAGEESGACSGNRCEGDIAVTCVGGRAHREDCTNRPYNTKCRNGVCERSGSACADELDRCQGALLQTCLDGQWKTFDCGSLGLGACQASKVGAACGAK